MSVFVKVFLKIAIIIALLLMKSNRKLLNREGIKFCLFLQDTLLIEMIKIYRWFIVIQIS